MSILIKGMEMPTSCWRCSISHLYERELVCKVTHEEVVRHKVDSNCPLIEIPPHGRLIDADALTVQMERNLWALEDKAEKELGFDETLRRGMQFGHAVCLNAVNDATVVFVPQIVHCCECEHNNHCLTQEFVEEESKIPFDKNTWFCADAKAAPTIIEAEGE